MIKCVTVTKRMRGTMSESKEKCIFMNKRIGSTVFKVKVYLPEDGIETAEEKMLRIIQNEVMTADEKCGITKTPSSECEQNLVSSQKFNDESLNFSKKARCKMKLQYPTG